MVRANNDSIWFISFEHSFKVQSTGPHPYRLPPKCTIALIMAVFQITDDIPSVDPNIPNVSLLVQTPSRNLKLTAPTRQKHDLWFQVRTQSSNSEFVTRVNIFVNSSSLPHNSPCPTSCPDPRHPVQTADPIIRLGQRCKLLERVVAAVKLPMAWVTGMPCWRSAMNTLSERRDRLVGSRQCLVAPKRTPLLALLMQGPPQRNCNNSVHLPHRPQSLE